MQEGQARVEQADPHEGPKHARPTGRRGGVRSTAAIERRTALRAKYLQRTHTYVQLFHLVLRRSIDIFFRSRNGSSVLLLTDPKGIGSYVTYTYYERARPTERLRNMHIQSLG